MAPTMSRLRAALSPAKSHRRRCRFGAPNRRARIEFDLFGDRGVPFENETTTSGGMTTRASVSVYAAYDHVDRDYTTSSAYAGGGPPVVFTFSQDRQRLDHEQPASPLPEQDRKSTRLNSSH